MQQPIHTVYGGAHLFRADSAPKLGTLARRALDEHAPDVATFRAVFGLPSDELASAVLLRVRSKLAAAPVEDQRIDFEDGFGVRPDDEEDAAAVEAAGQVAAGREAGTLAGRVGIRVKAFSPELRDRSARTADLFVGALLDRTGGALPPGFVVTLPKPASVAEVADFTAMLAALEATRGLPVGALRCELMVETPQALVDADGRCPLPAMVAATGGRCVALHFGAYDYTAACGVTAAFQALRHPLCDYARSVLVVAFAGSDVWLSDGATNVLPVAVHRPATTPAQADENRAAIHAAWRLHADDVTHGLTSGLYQGWDLHPAQLMSRYAAVYAFYARALPAATARLRNFVGQAARATMVREVFDDAATGQGLLNFFLRGLSCGALVEADVLAAGLTVAELQTRSFAAIVRGGGG